MNAATSIQEVPAEPDGTAHSATLSEVREEVLAILDHCQGYWRDTLRRSVLPKHENSTPFSGRFLADLALGFLALARAGQQDAIVLVHNLLARVATTQSPSGAFHWLLPDPGAPADGTGVPDQVDLAIVMDLLRHCLESELVEPETRDLCRKMSRNAIRFLRGTERRMHPGTIRKRDYGPGSDSGVDVLNGDAMAIKAFFCASKLHGDPTARREALRFSIHLQRRFGRRYPGWWPYSECLEPRQIVPADQDGRSLFFQSMMVVHLRDCLPWLNQSGMEKVLQDATRAVAQFAGMDGEIDDQAESRQEFVGKPNLLVCDCLADGAMPDAIKAVRRLRNIRRTMLRPGGDIVDLFGNPLPEMWKAWLFSDAARMFLRLNNQSRELAATAPLALP